MPVTLEIAGRAVSRLGSAAPNAPVVVRDVTTLVTTPTVWSGVTDENGYFVTPLLDDAKVYRADVQYDASNQYKAVRDIASGQMNMLQVRKRLHVQGGASPAVFDGPVTIAGNVTLSGQIVGPAVVSGALTVTGVLNAGNLQIGGQALDDRFYNVGETVALATNASALGGVAPAGYSPAAHTHAYSPTSHDHAATYAPVAHTHAYAPTAHDHTGVYGRVEVVQYDGNNAQPRAIYTPPAGWAAYAAIIHEVIGAGSFAIVSRSANFERGGCTNAFANTGPGADEITPGGCFFDQLNGGALTLNGANAGVAMNFGGSGYIATIFLKDT